MKLKDPVSSLTHLVALGLTIIFGIPLIIRGFNKSVISGISMLIFIVGMSLLYMASSTYHAVDSTPRINRILKKLDHCMIFILIASSYTPICVIALGNRKSLILLLIVWIIALLGIIIKLCIIYHPKWISSVLYIAMGWICIILVVDIYINLTFAGFMWLLIGGIMYTVGGVIYGMKMKIFNSKHELWGSHEIFHIFVMLGSACHYIVMWNYVL